MNFKEITVFILGLLIVGCTENFGEIDNALPITTAGITNGNPSVVDSPAALSTVGLVRFKSVYINRESLDTKQVAVSFCTGTIISENVILTATHCLVEDYMADEMVPRKKDFYVKLGINMNDGEGKLNPLLEVESFIIHPGFKIVRFELEGYKPISLFNDIALIKLKTKIPASFKPVAVIDRNLRLPENTDLLLAGWGATAYGARLFDEPSQLQEVTVKLQGYWSSHLITNQLDGKGGCMGDSGGPAYVINDDGSLVVVGATKGPMAPYSFCDYFVEYSNISTFKDFIISSVSSLRGSSPKFITPKFSLPFVFDMTEPTGINDELLPLMPERKRW